MRVLHTATGVAAVVITALAAGTAFAAGGSTFTAKYAGTVTEKVNGNTIVAAVKGSGSGKLVGVSKLAGTATGTTSPESACAPFFGPGTITGAKGTLKLKVVAGSRACAAGEDDRDNISFSGTATVTGGSGKFKKTRGSLHFSGHYDRAGGAFTVKFTGRVTP
jgi:hypothetical protein